MLRISSSIIKSFTPCRPDKIQREREKHTLVAQLREWSDHVSDSGLTNEYVIC